MRIFDSSSIISDFQTQHIMDIIKGMFYLVQLSLKDNANQFISMGRTKKRTMKIKKKHLTNKAFMSQQEVDQKQVEQN